MNVLSENSINYILTELDGDNLVAIGLTGSYARGTATPHSDVDIYRFGQQPAKDHYTLRMIDGHLVSITKATIEAKRADLTEPDSAMWAVPGLRQMQILLDKSGELAALKQEAENFQWKPLQPAADYYASAELMGNAEEAHKILSALSIGDAEMIIYAATGLIFGLARVLLVQRGVLIESENGFFRQAQETAGIASHWSQQFRIATGLEPLADPLRMRGYASLALYEETVRLLRAIIAPEHTEVIDTTLNHIAAFRG